MKSDLLELINIGESLLKKLNKIGIFTKSQFLSSDPYVLFEKMLQKINPTLPAPMLSSLVGAKENIPWYLINEECKSEFKKRHPNHRWQKYLK